MTYEPQVASDVFAMFQSLVEGRIVDWSLMTKDVRPEYHHDLDYLVGMLDWDANVNPEFGKTNKVSPKPVHPPEATGESGYSEKWVTYGTPHYSAKELTVLPGRTATITRQCCIRIDPDSGTRAFWKTSGSHAGHDPIRRNDAGRIVRHAPPRPRPA